MINFYEFFNILEGQAEDFVKLNPELQPALDQGIKNINYLKWLNKNKEKEPLEDIIGLIASFEKNKQRLEIKDINKYDSSSLRLAIENLGRSKSEVARELKQEETTKLGEFGDWMVVMPHSRESSCQWGKGTTWCTSATQSSNLFYNYTARKDENIILYYAIKKDADPRQNPNAKISIGFVNNEPDLSGRYGGLTVNANNDGLNEFKLKEIFGNQYENIMNVMKNHSTSLEGKHPAKKNVELIAKSKDPRILEKYISGMKPEEEKDFINVLMEYNPSKEIIIYLLNNNKLSDFNINYLLFNATNKQEMCKIIIQYKKELTKNIIYGLLNYATNKQEIANALGQEKINKLNNKHIYNLLNSATNKQEMADILGQENINKLSDSDILNLLFKATNKQEMADILGQENINKLTNVGIYYLLRNATNKQEMANLIIQYKKVTDHNIYDLLLYATNKQETANMLGQENINKLNNNYIYHLLNKATNKQEMANILGQENINKLSDINIYDLLDNATNKQEMADILGQKTYE